MEKKEKVELILEQMRYCLANKDFIRTQIISKKISVRFFDKDEHQVRKKTKVFHSYVCPVAIFFRSHILIPWSKIRVVENKCSDLHQQQLFLGFKAPLLRVHDRVRPARGYVPQHMSPLPRRLRNALHSRQPVGEAEDPQTRCPFCRSQVRIVYIFKHTKYETANTV